MTRFKASTKKIDKKLYKNYVIKAKQFLNTTRGALLEEDWNAVGLNSVHAVISANDALSVFYHGLRGTSEKHSDAIELLIDVFQEKEAREQVKHLTWLIGRKNLVEYESRLFFQKEAEEAAKHAERFVAWALEKLPS